MVNLNIFQVLSNSSCKFLGKQVELALKWKTGFPNHFEGFSTSCRDGAEYVLLLVAAEDFSFAGTFNYSTFPLNIFEMCFSRGKTGWSEIRHNLTDGRRDFQKRLKDTWGKNSSLISAIRRVQAIHVGCLLGWSQYRRLMPLEVHWAGGSCLGLALMWIWTNMPTNWPRSFVFQVRTELSSAFCRELEN